MAQVACELKGVWGPSSSISPTPWLRYLSVVPQSGTGTTISGPLLLARAQQALRAVWPGGARGVQE